MLRAQILAIILASVAGAQSVSQHVSEWGEQAMETTRRLTDMGPRPAGSEANARQQQFIIERLRRANCEIQQIGFNAETPLGRKPMRNIIAKFPGKSRRIVVISGHYDTYYRPGLNFVGANDAGSSTALLLTLADILGQRGELADPVWLVFFDGEESTVEWKDEDHTYGSRKQAQLWASNGRKDYIKALINVDMIGDADLEILFEGQSTPWLRELVFAKAAELGYAKNFPAGAPAFIEDDHVEFVRRGFPALNLIDFNYGFFNRLWHSEGDTVENLSARSFGVVTHVLLESLEELEKRP